MSDTPIYAVGDIHGQLDFLDAALERIAKDGGTQARILFVGDLVDRGPDSAGVIDRLIEGMETRPWTVLKGNHDRMFELFLKRGELHDANIKSGLAWLHPRLGGVATLASYGVEAADERALDDVLEEARQNVPAAHRAFIETLPLTEETETLFFCHAGIRPGVPLDRQDEEDLLWIRQDFLTDTTRHPKLVVHGHTPVDRPTHHGNHLNLDCGAGYGAAIEPVVIEAPDTVYQLTENGRTRIRPARSAWERLTRPLR